MNAVPELQVVPNPKRDWSNVDWTKPNAQIAKEMGVTVPAVYQQRKKRAPESITFTKKLGIDWAAVDWSQTSPEIARQLGCSTVTVNQRRIRHATYIWVPETLDELESRLAAAIEEAKKHPESTDPISPFQDALALIYQYERIKREVFGVEFVPTVAQVRK